MDDKNQLVQQIQQIQQSSQEEKQKWYDFCQSKCPGCYDPAKHSVSFLQGFMLCFLADDIPPPPPMTNYLRFRGLEFSASKDDVCEFLAEFGTEPDHVVMGFGSGGRPNGEACIGFATVEVAEQVMQTKNKQQMGTRYVAIHKSKLQEWLAAAKPNNSTLAGYGMTLDNSSYGMGGRPARGMGSRPAPVQSGPPAVKLARIPAAATAMDVASFLNEYGIQPYQVVISPADEISTWRGVPTGKAIVTVPDEDTADRIILDRNGHEIAGIEIVVTRHFAEVQGGGMMGGASGGMMGGGYGAARGGGQQQQRPSPLGGGQFNPREQISEEQHTGIIHKFDPNKKFGFIDCDELKIQFGCDVFLSDRQIGPFENGHTVSFQYIVKNGKPQAINLGATEMGRASNSRGGGEQHQRISPAHTGFTPKEPISEEQHIGTIMKFDPNKKFGFIECAEMKEQFGCDAFLSNMQIGQFENGHTVSFHYMVKNGKPQAVNLCAVEGFT